MRRVISVWLNRFTTDRLTRSRWRGQTAPYAPWRDRPLATVAAQAGAFRIAAANAAAQAAGVDPGLSLPDARAVVPALKVVEADEAVDQTCLSHLVTWCRRYTPWVTPEIVNDKDGSGGLWLDVTGCTHLFGGEQAMLNDLSVRLGQLGFTARLGLADTPGAAWAAAHHLAQANTPALIPEKEHRSQLENVPVSALRLSAAAQETLARLGVRTITDLLSLPRAPLTRRFGSEVCLRLDQLTGRVDEPLSPEVERLPYVARMVFPEPIGRTEDVEEALRMLLTSLCKRLEKDRRGARRLTCEIFRIDNTAERLQVGTGRAVRHPDHLFRLFHEKLDGLDAGFGIEFLLLVVTATDPLNVAQDTLPQTPNISPAAGPENPGRNLALLIDRLEGRLGPGRVVRPRVRDSHIPERAAGMVPALHPRQGQMQLDRDAGLLHSDRVRLRSGARPIFLLPRPEAVRPLPVDGPRVKTIPFAGFEWRRACHRLAVAEGPERIAGRWWQGLLPADRSDEGASYFALCEDGGAVRDYWRVESEDGLRFWVFHLPFPLAASGPDHVERWFVHGLFS